MPLVFVRVYRDLPVTVGIEHVVYLTMRAGNTAPYTNVIGFVSRFSSYRGWGDEWKEGKCPSLTSGNIGKVSS